MPSVSAYCLSGVSLTLDVGCLFTAAPAKHSCCSLPWMWDISSQFPFLTLDMGFLLSAAAPDLGRGISLHSCCSWPWTWGISSQPPLLTLDMGFLLAAATPDLGREVYPLSHSSLQCCAATTGCSSTGQVPRATPAPGLVINLLEHFPGGSDDKESARRPGFHYWVGTIPWRREWLPTSVSFLENSMDSGAWQAPFHGAVKSQTWLSN